MNETEIKQKVLQKLMDLMDDSIVSSLDRKKKPKEEEPEEPEVDEEEPEVDEEEPEVDEEESDDSGSRLMERLKALRKKKEK